MTFNDWWIENCIKRGKRRIYVDEVEEAWNAGRKDGLLEAAEIAKHQQNKWISKGYIIESAARIMSEEIADVIRAKAKGGE